jgi:FKBP-type peptidyl-prolyl cis-trans isomerase
LWVDGTTEIVDSSYQRNQPFAFPIGSGQVIVGLDQGVVGMRVRGLRELVIPPEMAYGDRGYPPAIPERATIVMRVELLELAP